VEVFTLRKINYGGFQKPPQLDAPQAISGGF